MGLNQVLSNTYLSLVQLGKLLGSRATNPLFVSTSQTPLGYDAWGHSKTVTDYSLFHGMFTLEVPYEMWIEHIDTTEVSTFTNFTSNNGMLKCQGVNGQLNFLTSKRHPRYQPNKGHLYSSSMILPDASLPINQDFGISTPQSGIMFRVNNGLVYAVRRTYVSGAVSEIVEQIKVPSNIDLTKGNIFDIQMQWRGVGNIKFFINQKLVHTLKLLGTLDIISIFNPALPIYFAVDGEATMYCGCVDITSEGGKTENRQRGTADSDEMSISSTETLALLIRLPQEIVYEGNNVINTRDIALRRVSAYANDDSIARVYYTRDGSKFTGTAWSSQNAISTVEYSVNGDIAIDNLTAGLKKVATRRIPANDNILITNPDELAGEHYLTHGDYFLITIQAKNNTQGGATLEWGAEI